MDFTGATKGLASLRGGGGIVYGGFRILTSSPTREYYLPNQANIGLETGVYIVIVQGVTRPQRG